MPFRKCVDNREPEAGANRSFGGEKWLEDTIPDFWRDSRTVIGDFDPAPAVGWTGADRDGAFSGECVRRAEEGGLAFLVARWRLIDSSG